MTIPKTTRGLMILVAIVGLLLGIAINVAPFLPLVVAAAIILSPQIIVVGICAYLSVREERRRARRNSSESPEGQ